MFLLGLMEMPLRSLSSTLCGLQRCHSLLHLYFPISDTLPRAVPQRGARSVPPQLVCFHFSFIRDSQQIVRRREAGQMCSITARDTELLTPDSKLDITYQRLLLLLLLFLFHFIFFLPPVVRVSVLLCNE